MTLMWSFSTFWSIYLSGNYFLKNFSFFKSKTSTASGTDALWKSLFQDSVNVWSQFSLLFFFFFSSVGGGCAAENSVTASSWQQSRTSSKCTSPTSLCVRGIAFAARTSETSSNTMNNEQSCLMFMCEFNHRVLTLSQRYNLEFKLTF